MSTCAPHFVNEMFWKIEKYHINPSVKRREDINIWNNSWPKHENYAENFMPLVVQINGSKISEIEVQTTILKETYSSKNYCALIPFLLEHTNQFLEESELFHPKRFVQNKDFYMLVYQTSTAKSKS